MNSTHDTLLQVHRIFGYGELIILGLFLIALLKSAFSESGKISNFIRKSTLFSMIVFHLQLAIGLIMLFVTSGFTAYLKDPGMGGIMKDKALRYTFIEHPVSMLIGAILMTVLNKKFKTNDRMRMPWMILAAIAIALFLYAVPFDRLLGTR